MATILPGCRSCFLNTCTSAPGPDPCLSLDLLERKNAYGRYIGRCIASYRNGRCASRWNFANVLQGKLKLCVAWRYSPSVFLIKKKIFLLAIESPTVRNPCCTPEIAGGMTP